MGSTSEEEFEDVLSTYFASCHAKESNLNVINQQEMSKRPMKAPKMLSNEMIQHAQEEILYEKRETLEKKRQKLKKKRTSFARQINEEREKYTANMPNLYHDHSKLTQRILEYKKNLKIHNNIMDNNNTHEISIPEIVEITTHGQLSIPIPNQRLLNINYDKIASLLSRDDTILYTNDMDDYYCAVFCNLDDNPISYVIIKKTCLI